MATIKMIYNVRVRQGSWYSRCVMELLMANHYAADSSFKNTYDSVLHFAQ